MLIENAIVPVVSDEVRGKQRLGLIEAAPVRVAPASLKLDAEIDELARTLASRHAGKSPAEILGLRPARELYHAYGVDPTRIRPSSESLLRRALQGKPLPRILSAVDVCNLCALQFLLPIGLYDVARIRGRVTLRAGRPGESYAGIRKEAVHVGGRPALADDDGAFGNPTSDSLRTSITEATRHLFMVVFAPVSFPEPMLAEHAAWAAAAMRRHLAPEDADVQTATAVVV